jgi:sRNA-binding protein
MAYTDPPISRNAPLAKPNYSFEKRQRELAKKKQQDEKQAKKKEAREAAKTTTDTGRPPSDSGR